MLETGIKLLERKDRLNVNFSHTAISQLFKYPEFANGVDLDDHEPPHLDIHCLPYSLQVLNMIQLELYIFLKFADENFGVCFLEVKELWTLWKIVCYIVLDIKS